MLRRLVALLMATFATFMFTVSASAATVSQDGLTATLSTDSQHYSAADTITSTLTVQNTNAYSVDNVSISISVPNGYMLVDGFNDSQTIASLDAGSSLSLIIQMRNPNATVPDLPQTGDGSHIGLWFTMMIVSIVLLCLTPKWMKNGMCKKGISGMLVLALFLSGMSNVATAEIQTYSLSISHGVTVNGHSMSIMGTVTYGVGGSGVGSDEISFTKPTAEHIVYNESNDTYYVDNEILITTVPGTPRTYIDALAAANGGTIVGAIDITGDYQVRFTEKMSYQQLNNIVAVFSNSSIVENAMLHTLQVESFEAVPNDTKWKNEEWSAEFPEGINWGVEAIDAIGAWDYRSQMQRVNVGIIDSMFDTTHDDLNFYKVWNNPDFDIGWFDSEYSTKAHGTHVAGTFTAMYNNSKGIAGVAPELLRYGYSILGDATDSVILDTDKSLMGLMEWKYALALLVTSECRVINVSMGSATPGAYTQDLYDSLDRFISKLVNQGYDFLIVQAAGNDMVDASLAGIFVGCKQNRDRILVTGAVSTNGSHNDGFLGLLGSRVFDGYEYAVWDRSISSGSNWGTRVDIVAPGTKIYSTVPGNGYEDSFMLGLADWNGTSMAAPHAAGVAALCYSVNPNLTAVEVKKIIIDSASDTGSTFISRNGDTRNYPLLDAKDAVDLALTYDASEIELPEMGTVMGSLFISGSNRTQTIDADIAAYMTYSYENSTADFSASTIVELSDGGYVLSLEPGIYTISYFKEGYIPFIASNVKVFDNQVTYLDDVFLIEDTTPQDVAISGRVTDSITGAGVSGVEMTFYPGWNNTCIIPEIWHNRLVTCSTDSSGNYSATLPEGCYTAVMVKTGYANGSMNVISARNQTGKQNGVISPLQADDQYRIVLTWGESPSDLDSHLTGSMNGGIHVYYSDKESTINGSMIADLDLDDTSSYGPETVTIYLPDSGAFRYSVHDYSNRNSSSSNAMARSGAKVTVYKGNECIATYPVPNNAGTAWTVFDLENGVITPVNTVSYVSDPEDVGSFVSTFRMTRTLEYHEDDKDYN